MKFNPTKIKPAELIRILNSAGFGEVISGSTLHRHRNRAGYAIGDGQTVDLLRYAAWMTGLYLEPKAPKQDYADKKEASRQRNLEGYNVLRSA